MVVRLSVTLVEQYDEDGRLVYQEDSDGYIERNTYYNGKLIKSDITYSNGIREVEQFNPNT